MVAPRDPVGYDGATMHWIRTALKTLLVTVAWGGLALALLIPLARTSSDPTRAGLGVLGHALFSPFCHQRSERCFAVAGESMPLCTRCVGILVGLAVGGLAGWAGPVRPARRYRALLLGAGLVMAGEWFCGWCFAYDFDWLRFATGCLLGVAAGLGLMAALDQLSVPAASGRKERISPCTF